ncbi:ABC transporter ATP-binding protein/permease [Prochlorococcus sp. AH-716-D13]|nr:ABC transporter ATP-binding protein/permease [Prochlorococcus sp. AH-716-D13]
MNRNIKILDVLKISFSMLERKDKLSLLLLSITSFFGSLLELMALTSVLPFISLIFNEKLIKENNSLNFIWEFLNKPLYKEFVLILALTIAFSLILSTIFTYIVQFLSNRFAAKCQEKYGVKLFNLLLKTNYEWHIIKNSTLLMTIFISHISLWNRGFIRQIPLLISNLTLIIIPSITLILLAPKYGILLILFASFSVSKLLGYVRKKSNFLSRKAKESQEEVTMYVNEVLQGIKDVKLSSNELIFVKRFKSFYHIYSMYLAKASNWNQIPNSFILLLSQLSILFVGTLLVSIGLKAENIISVMTIAALFASKIIPSLNKIGSTLTSISNKSSWIKSLNEIFLDTKKNLEYKSLKSINKKNWSNLKLNNVSYSYPSSKREAIKDFNIEIKKGLHYGFVGESGSGKSTTIDLILGLLLPTEGLVQVDNVPLEDIGINNWQTNIGYVPQKPLLINVSLKENIAFGIEPKLIDEKRVFECIKLASLEDLVNLLPNGINSKLGERGKFLSGGQEQRVAIARALYQNPSILIFDEATSFQDYKNENLIRKSINNLKGDVTVLSISHKFSFIKNCDKIFVLEKGLIKEEVSYKDFINKSDYYKKTEKYLNES